MYKKTHTHKQILSMLNLFNLENFNVRRIIHVEPDSLPMTTNLTGKDFVSKRAITMGCEQI